MYEFDPNIVGFEFVVVIYHITIVAIGQWTWVVEEIFALFNRMVEPGIYFFQRGLIDQEPKKGHIWQLKKNQKHIRLIKPLIYKYAHLLKQKVIEYFQQKYTFLAAPAYCNCKIHRASLFFTYECY